jgi:hypothetical protein
MKKLILTIILFCACYSILPTPGMKYLYIPIAKPIIYYDYEQLIKAIVTVESNWDQYAFNPVGESVSWFQIRSGKVKDFNNLTGKNYTLLDMYDFNKAKEVFMYFTKGRDYETIARAWCGGEYASKESTNDYWNKIKMRL